MDRPTFSDPKKNRAWYAPIETRDDAVKAIRDLSFVFIGLAALQFAFAFLDKADELLINGVSNLVLGTMLYKFHSRMAAVLLVVLKGSTLVMILANLHDRFVSLAFGVFMVGLALRAVKATFYLHKPGKV